MSRIDPSDEPEPSMWGCGPLLYGTIAVLVVLLFLMLFGGLLDAVLG